MKSCASGNRDEAIPKLLDFLAGAIRNHKMAEEWNDDLGFVGYTVHLLAEFGAHEALPLFLDILELDEERCYRIIGDTLTEGMAALIASVAEAGDIDRIKAVVENTGLVCFHRIAALNSLLALYIRGICSRNELAAYSGYLLDTSTDIEFTSCAVCFCEDIAAREHYGRIRELFKEDRVDRFMIGPEHFAENAPVVSEKEALEKLRKRSCNRMITDTIESMQWWASFNENKPKNTGRGGDKKPAPRDFAGVFPEDHLQRQNASVVNPPKVGRNDPCPCGSGNKIPRSKLRGISFSRGNGLGDNTLYPHALLLVSTAASSGVLTPRHE